MQILHKRVIVRKITLFLLGLALLGIFFMPSCSLFHKGGSAGAGQIISPDGGVLEFDDGIQMIVPPNAVSEEAIIHLTPVDNTEVADILEDALIPLQPITFFQVSLENGKLQNTVTVVLPIDNTGNYIGIPIHVEIDRDTGAVNYPSTNLTYDPDAETIELDLNSFSTHGIGKKPEMEGPTECENPATACRCGSIYIESKDHDYSSGECQSITSELSVQFLDCPGQPTEKDKVSERTPDCDWKGSIAFHYQVNVEGMEWHVNCSDPIPFTINEDNSLSGGGSMHCELNQNLGDGGHLEMEYDEEVKLSGTFDGFELDFDPPEEKVIKGRVKIWAMVEGMEVSLLDASFDDKQATADMFVYPEATLFTSIVNFDSDKFDQPEYDFKFPLEDNSTVEITIPGDGSTALLTLTLGLDVE